MKRKETETLEPLEQLHSWYVSLTVSHKAKQNKPEVIVQWSVIIWSISYYDLCSAGTGGSAEAA